MAEDRWAPKPHVLCRVNPDEHGAEVSPDGVWQVLAHGPESPTSWWLMPIDGDACRWASTHPGEVHSQCVQVTGRRLRPKRELTAPRAGASR